MASNANKPSCDDCAMQVTDLYMALRNNEDINNELVGQIHALNMLVDMVLGRLAKYDAKWVAKVKQRRLKGD